MSEQKKRKETVFSAILLVLFIVYMCALFRITVFRSSFSFDGLCENGEVNLDFFGNLLFIAGNDIKVFLYYFIGNIIWFVPLGMYMAYSWRRVPLICLTAIGLLVSLTIEVGQYVFGTGVSEIDDLFLNTLGCFLGALAVRVFLYLIKKKKKK